MVNKLITEKRMLGYVNELTVFLDEHMKTMNLGRLYTYLNEIKSYDNMLGIRFPGATRGHIEIDNDNIITHIKMYSMGRSLYGEHIEEELQKFIGYQIIEKENNDENN